MAMTAEQEAKFGKALDMLKKHQDALDKTLATFRNDCAGLSLESPVVFEPEVAWREVGEGVRLDIKLKFKGKP